MAILTLLAAEVPRRRSKHHAKGWTLKASIPFVQATRRCSVPTAPMTWGGIKALYH